MRPTPANCSRQNVHEERPLFELAMNDSRGVSPASHGLLFKTLLVVPLNERQRRDQSHRQ